MTKTSSVHAFLVSLAFWVGGSALAAPAANGDKVFLAQALDINRFELALGRLAIARASTPEVQAMGKKMFDRHTQIGQQLSEQANAIGMKPPAEAAHNDDGRILRLSGLAGGDFDREFKETVDTTHRHELTLYEGEAKSTKNAKLRALVESRVTSLRQNLMPKPAGPAKNDW